jgi:uncharacterized LabA/DUF88 family protein
MPYRVIVYVDGFNLYFGLKTSGWQRYYWLNIQKLAQNILKPDQSLIHTKYFTSRVKNPSDKRQRQNIFLEALGTLTDTTIYYGKYHLHRRCCPRCGYVDYVPSEKMTDVNIATEMMADAFQDKFDTAILISADSDLTRTVKKIKTIFPHKRVVVVFPPNRSSADLKYIAQESFQLGRGVIKASLFPNEIIKADGFKLVKPEQWS